MNATELSRPIKVRPLPGDLVQIEADAQERAALAARFALPSVDVLSATITLEESDQSIIASGSLTAEIVQSCAVSGEDFPVSIEEDVNLRFVRELALRTRETDDGEIEVDLSTEDDDEIEYSGDMFDLGEAIAQTLGLAIDPYAEGPNAENARKAAGISGDDKPSGPLAEALAALKKD